MRRSWLVLLILPGISIAAEPGIHRCTQQDGTVAFQQTPCPEPAQNGGDDGRQDDREPASAEGLVDSAETDSEAVERPAGDDRAPPAPASRDRADCETRTRNAIDAIDLEMRKGFSKEQGERYLAELLELTQQLRGCKEL